MKSNIFLSLIIFVLLLLPAVSFAQNFVPLVEIPGVNGNADFNTYINTLYALSISIAGLLAVIKIIIAGIKWMLSDVVTSKQEAKSDIQGALFGLLIVISAVLILNIINPQLTQTTLFVGPVDKAPSSSTGGTGVPGAPANANVSVQNSTINCLPVTVNGVASYDCSSANEACTTSQGQPSPFRDVNGVERINKITCANVVVY